MCIGEDAAKKSHTSSERHLNEHVPDNIGLLAEQCTSSLFLCKKDGGKKINFPLITDD